MRYPLLLVLLACPAAAQPPSCSNATFPFDFSGYESMGNAQAPGLTTAAACQAACCARAGCTLWQFCPPGTLCETTQGPSCWIGNVSEPTHRSGGWVGRATAPPPGPNFTIPLSRPPAAAPIPNIPTATSPSGATLALDSLSLRLNGAPILPICGELHPGRVPAASWRSDLLRMKAGGLTVVNSYVFWLHVEEVQGHADWSGSNNLTHFLQLAQEVGLLVALRIGPWCHGEARNGGLPDWVLAACKAGGFGCRTAAPGFMALARGWYAQLAAQVQGLGFAQGGPVISIQLDNETPDVAYLEALRGLGVELGLAPAWWVKTGWPSPSSAVPYGTLVPLYGGYFDDFWTSITDIDLGNFLFNSNPNPAPLPPALAGGAADAEPYPFLTVEVGGGMASSYRRRIHVNPDDAVAQAYVFMGSGVASLGFYVRGRRQSLSSLLAVTASFAPYPTAPPPHNTTPNCRCTTAALTPWAPSPPFKSPASMTTPMTCPLKLTIFTRRWARRGSPAPTTTAFARWAPSLPPGAPGWRPCPLSSPPRSPPARRTRRRCAWQRAATAPRAWSFSTTTKSMSI